MGNGSTGSCIGNTDYADLNIQKETVRHCLCHSDDLYLEKITWWYNWVGETRLHRVIELTFQCENKECKKRQIIRMEKFKSGKKIQIVENYLDSPNSSCWEKKPKKRMSYKDCLRLFDEASGEYNGISNNCMHFAYSIWNNV